MTWKTEEVLVIVKVYPAPSNKYGEIVCTAGITRGSKWIRLYPIQYRDLSVNQQYNKFQWIRVKITPSNEMLRRPESYKIDTSSIELLKKVSYKFRYLFHCNDKNCNGHDIQIFDWETAQSYWRFKNLYKDENLTKQKLREKWLDYFFKKRESYFVVGTDSRWNKFMILTIVSPRRKTDQFPLFQ